MRIALSGAAGIGKTTLARRLAEHFGVPLLDENLAGVVRAFNAERPADPGANQARVDACRSACLDWLDRREADYRTLPGFVEDRCAIDILFRWLLENLSDRDNAQTQTLMQRTRLLLAPLDAVIVPPLTLTGETHNEQGLARAGSFSRLLRAQSLALGLATQLVEPERLIRIPEDCATPVARLQFVLARLPLG